jgi:hypothetical protein
MIVPNGISGNFTIPNGVTSIGSYAFAGCTGLTDIIIPNSVTNIGWRAFENTGIWNNTPNNSVVYADKWAVGIRGVISDSLTLRADTVGIGSSAFFNHTGLTSVTIPDSVTTIGSSAFSACTGLTNVSIGNNVTVIGNGAFGGCTGLTNIVIPNSVTSIEFQAFANTGLTSITIPDSVTSIGNHAFERCTSLTTVVFDGTTPPSLSSFVFDNTHSTLKIFVPAGSAETYRAVLERNRIHSVGCGLDNPASGSDCSCQ